jgi:hypothetical protein
MKLVNIRKQYLVLLLFVTGFTPVQAQVWTLQQCIDTAQVYNKTLQIGRNNKAISQQKRKEAIANLNSKITANADYKYFTDLPTQLMPAPFLAARQELLRKHNLVCRIISMLIFN